MAIIDALSANNTSIAFDPASDVLAFRTGFPAAGLSLTQSGADVLLRHAGGISVRLLGRRLEDLLGTNFTFADASVARLGTVAGDVLAGTPMADYFDLGDGGSDTVSAGAGSDRIHVGAALDAGDRIDADFGLDEVILSGEYATLVVLQAGTITGVEALTLEPGSTVRLALHASTAAAGGLSASAARQLATDLLHLDASAAPFPIRVTGGAGRSELIGGAGGDTLSGGAGADSIAGGGGNDVISGDEGPDVLNGGTGDDLLQGGDGDDILHGGAGNDTLHGDAFRIGSTGAGTDLLTGGADADVFDFTGAAVFGRFFGSTLVLTDSITDFDPAEGDRLRVLATSSLQPAPLVLRGQVASQGFALAADMPLGGDDIGAGFTQLWSWHEAGTTYLIADIDDDRTLDEADFVLAITGPAAPITLAERDFVAGTFIVRVGTMGDDTLAGTTGHDRVYGLGGNDTITGVAGDDELHGGDGADSLDGGTGNDRLFGGAGADTLLGGADLDGLDGGPGSDVLDGGSGDDTLTSGDDDAGDVNQLSGGIGNDRLDGEDGIDLLDGGHGDDTLSGRGGDDVLTGGTGADTLTGGAGDDTLDGGAGRDTLTGDDAVGAAGSPGRDRLTGGADADTFRFTASTFISGTGSRFGFSGSSLQAIDTITDFRRSDGDLLALSTFAPLRPLVLRGEITTPGFALTEGALIGGSDLGPGFIQLWSHRSGSTTYLVVDENDDRLLDATDFVLAFTGPDAPTTFAQGDFTAGTFTAIVGTGAGDVLMGTAGNDRIHGAPGADDIDALAGDDTVFAGDGDDTVRGGDGHDVLDGGAGNDTLDGGDGSDRLSAGKDAADAMNWLQGGPGSDQLSGQDGADSLEGGTGDDSLSGGGGNDTLAGGDGHDTLWGGDGADLLRGGDGDDRLEGDAGDDVIEGGAGADILFGGGADDVGEGNDLLSGGEGADRFHFFLDGVTPNADRVESTLLRMDAITDFDAAAGDRLDLYAYASDRVLAFRGAVTTPGFTMHAGALLGGDDLGPGFTQLWTHRESHTTYLIADLDDDRLLDEQDFVLAFTGPAAPVTLAIGDFVPGTFRLLVGTPGDDDTTLLTPTAEADTVHGGGGNDELEGDAGTDALFGGPGNDALSGGPDDDALDGGDGNDQLQGDDGNDYLQAAAGDDRLEGGEGDDALDGGTGTDSLAGGGGNDMLHGGAGADVLDGGAGRDTLDGDGNHILGHDPRDGASRDRLTGGPDADVFDFSHPYDPSLEMRGSTLAATDLITDFDAAEGDRIQLTRYLPAKPFVLRGAVSTPDFTLESGAELGGEDLGHGFVQLWTHRLGDSTYLIADLDDDRFLGAGDFVLDINGPGVGMGITAGDFAANTFAIDVLTSGDDSVSGNDLANLLHGAAGNDRLVGLGGSDYLYGGAGNDVLLGGDGNDVFRVGRHDGIDSFDGGAGIDVIEVTASNVLLSMSSLAGIERIDAFAHRNVSIAGSVADDMLDFSATTLRGVRGIDGGNGDDTITGSAGADNIFGNLGTDTIDAREGNDTIRYGHGTNDFIDGGEGTDTLVSLANGATLDWTRVRNVEIVNAWSTFGDALTGTMGNDVLDFSNVHLQGVDRIDGLAGDDRVEGSAQDDVVVGGAGQDVLAGGGGRDTFVFEAASHSTPAFADVLLDFIAGQDLIDLRHIDADVRRPGDQAFTFIDGASFSGAAGELRHAQVAPGELLLEGDLDGDAQPDFALRLLGIPAMYLGDLAL